MKKEEMKKEVKMEKAPSGMMSKARRYLMQDVGILCILFGVPVSTVGVYGAVGGTGITLIVNVDQVVGIVFSIVGIAALAGGIVLCYVAFKLRRLNAVCLILGSCGLIIPSMIIGMGYFTAAGIVAIALGFPWLATLFLWLES